jgi:hypothetical protein
VWWLASIIGIEQGLIIHIDNLAKQLDISTGRVPQPVPNDKIQQERLVSLVPRDIQENPQCHSKADHTHPDGRNQIDNSNLDISNLDLGVPEIPPPDIVVSTESFLVKSRKKRKAFNKNKERDQLSRTRSGKVPTKPLTQGQRIYLQCIP